MPGSGLREEDTIWWTISSNISRAVLSPALSAKPRSPPPVTLRDSRVGWTITPMKWSGSSQNCLGDRRTRGVGAQLKHWNDALTHPGCMNYPDGKTGVFPLCPPSPPPQDKSGMLPLSGPLPLPAEEFWDNLVHEIGGGGVCCLQKRAIARDRRFALLSYPQILQRR